ncbi:hypothetical protein TanjilG_03359 [Lupinus angustifolius]|uniref:Uncharacterized protein n=1 Tax=Lupinus angustifolius TaxID=3871 RepID=A0A4P1RDM9_LUPAN|nr:PREDICTED: uncharacterized protein LOC109351530 [Lupinus angustifolius]OIW08683.1 hypothetical protein TanjilG_03359 [Lupinus angustifolius]
MLLIESSAQVIEGDNTEEFKFCKTDPKSILQQIKRQHKSINLKRRWLLGMKLTKSDNNNFNNSNLFLNESLLREDDIFYESVRTHVEGAFGGTGVERENHVPQDDMDLIGIPNIKLKRLISSCLNNLTNKGLYHLAMILNGGSIKAEITRSKLKRIIKDSLSSVLGRKSHDCDQVETRKKVFELLSNPHHFRDRCEPLSAIVSQSDRAAVKKVLHGVQSLPIQTLVAMNRKLRGKKGSMPQLLPRRNGWGRDRLIKLVKESIREMLLQLDRGNGLPEPLAKAMAVSDLSRRLIAGCHGTLSREFYKFSPEVKSLQDDIMNAIWSINKKVVTLPVLRKLKLLVEPEAMIPTRTLRTAFVSFLTEFLFHCSDMDRIPKSLTKILDSINRGSNSTHDTLFQKKDIEEEVDCLLSVSAQAKQVVLDLLPDHEFDQDFTDAYMEELEESEDSGSDEDDDVDQPKEDRQFTNGTFNSMDLNYEAESIGDFVPFQSHSSISMKQENVPSSGKSNSNCEKLQPSNCDRVNSASEVHNTPHNMGTDQFPGESEERVSTRVASKNYTKSDVSSDRESDGNVVKKLDFNETDTELDAKGTANSLRKETKPIPTKDSVCKNQYLAIQDSCDKTSMLAYNLIGHILKEFATNKGPDLNMSTSSDVSDNGRVENVEETKKESPSDKHATDSAAIVRAINELIPSFPDSGMEKLMMLMGS